MRRAYTIGAPSIFVNKNGLGRYPEFRDQGVGGSNPLSPTILLGNQEVERYEKLKEPPGKRQGVGFREISLPSYY